ncbi:MAG: thioredoxin-disulfide reductase [Bdellovibrionales bacterium]|nr:thioredoxin-disulfide reductase [Bdellovibrionales bacterium]
MERRKVIIIGTGPAGLTAAIYAARADLKPLILEGHEPGGQLTLTTEVENFPGFENGVMGPELMMTMKKQAARFNAEFMPVMCTGVDFSIRPFKVTIDNGTVFEADTVIISTGASAKWLGLPTEKELTGRGVSTCATCDGFFYRDKIVHVVGGGDTAMEDATFITKFAKKVYVVHRKDTLRASKPMQDRAFKNPKIEFLWDTTVSEIHSNQTGVSGITVENLKTGAKQNRDTDGLFYAIGHQPNTAFLKGQITLDDHGFIKTLNGPETNIPGVFACGDVQDSYYRQAITAAGSGCQAAMKAERFLEGH